MVVLAHRGWRGYYPENTLHALGLAAQLDIDGLEIDIHATADGELVVIHDDTVDRTTNGSGRVQDYTLAELKKLDAGYWWTADNGRTYPHRGVGITIPTLEELFRMLPGVWINVDIKQHAPSIVQPFADMIRAYQREALMCVGSFSNETVAEFRQVLPQVARAGSEQEARRLVVLNKLGLGRWYRDEADVFQIPERHQGIQVVTRRFVQDAHRANTAVHVWTVNEIEDMQRLLALGVDGLVTDFPERALKLLGRMHKEKRQRVSLVFVRDGQILLMVRRRLGNRYYILPGGGVEEGEDVETAAYREAKEETNFDITLGSEIWRRQRDPFMEEIAYLVTDFSGELLLGGPEAEKQSADDHYSFVWLPIAEACQQVLYPGHLDRVVIEEALAEVGK